ncbi:MAG: glycosyltransferase family 4 protein [Candidatus Methanomethylicaceae archaeon]
MKRIYMVSDVDLTEKSAQPIHLFSLAKYLAAFGLEVRLIYPFWQTELPRTPLGVIGVPICVPRRRFVRAALFQAKLLVKLGHLPRPDLVYVRLSAGMVAPLLWCAVVGLPLFVEVNGIMALEYLMSATGVADVRKWLKVKWIRIVEGLNLKNATGIVFVTDGLKRYYLQRYRISQENVTVINNGVDLEVFRPMDKKRSRQELGIQEEESLLGFVGLLASWQGLDDTIQAVKILRDRGVPCRLLIVGTGPEEVRLRVLAQELGVSDKVMFAGAVDWERVPLYINASDICLVCKKKLVSGTSPLKLYEYMACARPIVATDVPGLDVVANVGVGVLAKAGSPESIADAIEELIRRRHEWEDMGMRGRSYVDMNASWKRRAEDTLSFFKKRLI